MKDWLHLLHADGLLRFPLQCEGFGKESELKFLDFFHHFDDIDHAFQEDEQRIKHAQ